MMIRLTVAVMAFAMFSAPAFAEDAPPAKAEQPPKKKAVDDDKKLICERRHVVGSNIEAKVCKTKAEWDADRLAAKNSREDIYQRPVTGTVICRLDRSP